MSTGLTPSEPRHDDLPAPPAAPRTDEPWPRAYGRLAAALLVAGVAVRLIRYLLCFPLWGDEAWIALNIRDRDYGGFLRQLDHLQVAPILFLWAERAVADVLGFSEYALRLLPLLAGLGSLLLMGHLARQTLRPLAGVVAIGLLAVSRFPVSLSSQVKPYSFDLLFALALLVPAVHWLRHPGRDRWLLLLVGLVPVALAGSFPAVFVAGGIGLALLPEVWRRADPRTWLLFAAYNGATVAAFVLFDVVIAGRQLCSPGSRLHDYMTGYWGHGFPPFEALALVKWLVVVHTGLLMAYPLGNANGAGAVAFPFFVVGAVAAWRRGHRPLVLLCLAPFALNLVAAALHRYPYGGCCRLSQHLAPAVVLLVGVGVEAVVTRLVRTGSGRLRAARALAGLFGLLAVAGALLYAHKPYREDVDLWSRKVAREVAGRAEPGDRIVVLNTADEIPPVALWYLREAGAAVSPDGPADGRAAGGRVWCLSFGYGDVPIRADRLDAFLARGPVPLIPCGGCEYVLREGRGGPNWRVEVRCYEAAGVPARPAPRLSCWP